MSIRTINNIEIEPSIDSIGKIYSLNFEVPYERDTPSKLILNLINETGHYPKIQLSYLNPYKIKVFDGQFTFYMYLTGYTEDSSGGQKTLNLTFEDGSHILDRIYVGLMDVNVESTQFNSVSVPKVFIRKVVCDSCEINSAQKRFFTYPEVRNVKTSIPGQGVVGDNINGGFIKVGEEGFTKTYCDIPDIKYNFTQLKAAALGIGVFINIPDAFPNYTINVGGTLREVLTNFCNKFAVSPVYDFQILSPTVKYIDLKNSVSTYDAMMDLKNFVKTIRSTDANETVVLEVSDSESMGGTYNQYTSLSAKVAPQFQSSTVRQLNYLAYYAAWKVEHLYTPYSKEIYGRSLEQLMISSYLAAAYPTYRTLYNLSLRGIIPDKDALSACGFQLLHEIEQDQSIDFLANIINVTGSALTEKLKRFNAIGRNASKKVSDRADTTRFNIYIGNYWPREEESILEWERELHPFIGNYFTNTLESPEKTSYCPSNSVLSSEVEVSIKPEGRVYYRGAGPNASCDKSFPFKNLLREPLDVFGGKKSARILDRGDNTYSFTPQFIGHLLKSRYTSATFDAYCQTMTEETFDQKNANPLENFRPEWIPLSTAQLSTIYAGIVGTALEFAPLGVELLRKINDDPLSKDLSLHMALVPSVDLIDEVIEVSEIFETVNQKEKTWIEKTIKEGRIYCPPNICEIQKDYNVDTSSTGPCACNTAPSMNASEVSSPRSVEYTDGPEPAGALICAAFTVTLKNINGSTRGNSFDIVFPFGSRLGLEEFYRANYKETLVRHEFHYGLRKSINNFTTPPGNVSSVKVIHEEIGEKVLKSFSSLLNLNALNNPFLIPLEIESFTGGFLSFTDYFNLISTMSGLNSLYPRKSLKIKCGGTKFGSLLPYMTPAKGFTSVSVIYDKEGVRYDLNFESRPPKLPEAFLELFKDKMAMERGAK